MIESNTCTWWNWSFIACVMQNWKRTQVKMIWHLFLTNEINSSSLKVRSCIASQITIKFIPFLCNVIWKMMKSFEYTCKCLYNWWSLLSQRIQPKKIHRSSMVLSKFLYGSKKKILKYTCLRFYQKRNVEEWCKEV